MKLFPAIDILDGECVRLLRGDYSEVTKYGNPVEMAQRWEREGACYLHIVDLNAAKSGKSENLSVIGEIVDTIGIPVQAGGGVRTLDAVEERLRAGVRRVILGTVCCENPETVQRAVQELGAERIVCGVDAKNGCVATNGWTAQSHCTPVELGRNMYCAGVRYAVYTDISKDGMLIGANVAACIEMTEQTGLHVIASGGVSSAEDLIALKNAGLYGAILGKALYEEKITLKNALFVAKDGE